ncbi:MAG: ABC transporter permease, partial [Prevotellaceae bacterium]|nr:ABC transporter permease [Prevotellaceae bacterium]
LLCFSYSFYINRFMGSIDAGFDNYRRIAEVTVFDSRGGAYSGSPVTIDRELRRWAMKGVEAQTYVGHARLLPHEVEVSDDKHLPYDLLRMEVDSCFAQVFTPHIVAGSWQTAVRTPNALVLSGSTARRIFGTEADAVGKRFTMKHLPDEGSGQRGSLVYTVQAVMEDLPQNNSLSFMQPLDMLVVNDADGEVDVNSTDSGRLIGNIYLLLSPPTGPKDINDYIAARDYHPEVFGNLMEVKVARIGTRFNRQEAMSVVGWITGGIGLLILLVGLINFFLFFIGSFLNRSREFSILKLEGAGSKRLFGVLFTQTLMAVLPAGLLAFWGIELLNGRLDLDLGILKLHFSSALLMAHLLQYLLLLLAVGGVICLLVTLRIRRISILTGIYGGNRRRGKSVGRNVSLAVQFFICWLFVSFTAAFFLQSRTIDHSLLPTLTMQEKASILIVPLDYTFLPLAERQALVARIGSEAGVQEVMVTGENYLVSTVVTGIYYGEAAKRRIDGSVQVVPPNFFSFMNIPITQGRPMATTGEAVVDGALQRRLPPDDPSGMVLSLYDQTSYTVVGVSSPFVAMSYNPMMASGHLFVLGEQPEDEGQYAYCYLKCHPGQAREVAARVEAVCRERFPESVEVRVGTMLDAIREQQVMEYTFRYIILFLAVVSILITLLGVYSAITLDTERRRKEVAIRKVNGARAPQIAMLFTRLYLILLVATAAVAFPIIYIVLQQWKQWTVAFFDDGILFWLGIFLAVAAFTGLTIFFRIRRIARSNPAETIKSE